MISINKYILIRNLAVLFVICNLLYWFFPFRPVVWRILLLLLSLIVIGLEMKNLLLSEKIGLMFSSLIVLYFVFGLPASAGSLSGLGNVLCAFVTIPLFRFLSQKGVFTQKSILIILTLLLICSIFYFYYFRRVKILSIGLDEQDDVTINASVVFLYIIPLLFIVKNDIIKMVAILICFFYILLAAKRGNIVASVIPTLLLFYDFTKSHKSSIGKTVFVFLFLGGFIFAVHNWIIENDYLLHRIEQTEEGDSSGRDVIYNLAWNAWLNSENPVNLIGGYGYNATSTVVGAMAHSDWLEILVDYGLLGCMLFLAFFIALFSNVRRLKSNTQKFFLFSCVSILFLKSIFSMGLFNTTSYMLAMDIGIALGIGDNYLEKN